MTGKLLVDTGPIVAILLESDEHHEACVEQLHLIRGPLLSLFPWARRICPALPQSSPKYEGLRIQLADASLIHLANREGIEIMFTLDRRDFGVLRLAHGKKLRLIP